MVYWFRLFWVVYGLLLVHVSVCLFLCVWDWLVLLVCAFVGLEVSSLGRVFCAVECC